MKGVRCRRIRRPERAGGGPGRVSGGPRALPLRVCLSVLACFLAVYPVAAPGADGHPAMTDALGDTLPAGPYPRRIISLSPSLTEALFAVGVDSARIVGVTRYCDFPPEARLRPDMGGIIDPSLEAIVARQPDLVLVARGNPLEVQRRIRGLGFPVFAFDDRTGLRGVREILGQMVELTGPDDPARARAALERFDRVFGEFAAWSEGLPRDARPTVYYADPAYPAFTAGAGTHIDDLIRLAGGANLAGKSEGWPQYSAEELVLRQPRFLLLAAPAGTDRRAARRRLEETPGWSNLGALREDRICWIGAETLMRPGPRLLDALEELAGCLHPERKRTR